MTDLILSTLSFDSGRGGHTIETLIHALQGTGLVVSMETCGVCNHKQSSHGGGSYHCQDCIERLAYHHFMPGARTDITELVRIRVAELIDGGRLDIRADGLLMFSEELPEELVQQFGKDWFSVITGCRIGGPFKTEGEARSDLSGR